MNSDRLRRELFTERSYSEMEKDIVYRKMLDEMRNALAQNHRLVLDATFHKRNTRKLFTNEMQGNGKSVFIEVQADEEIIRERVKKEREYSGADIEVYKLIRQQNEPLTEPHLILLSTNEKIHEMLEKVAKYLKINHDEGTNK